MTIRISAALAAGALSLWLNAGAAAQNVICPTVPFGDSSSACANTQFVQGAVVGGPSLTQNQFYIGNAANVPVATALSGDCTYGGSIVCTKTNGATIASLTAAGQTLSGGATVTAANLGTVSSGTLTINCGTVGLQFFTNNGAFTLAAPVADSSCIVLMTNGASAGAVTPSGFSPSTCGGDAFTTTNTSIFFIHIVRINSKATCSTRAGQ